jgi:hypothetical protein
MELALGGYAGFHTTTPPSAESAYGVYWPALVPAWVVEHTVVLPDGSRRTIPHPASGPQRRVSVPPTDKTAELVGPSWQLPLGALCGARSGDKGGNANVGIWARNDAAYGWLSGFLTVEKFRELLPEACELEIRRYELANLRALNFVVVGLLGSGVAASVRPDPQAKGLGEYLRSRLVDVPESVLTEGQRDGLH